MMKKSLVLMLMLSSLAVFGACADKAASDTPQSDALSDETSAETVPENTDVPQTIGVRNNVSIFNIAYLKTTDLYGVYSFADTSNAADGGSFACDFFSTADFDTVLDDLHNGKVDMAFIPADEAAKNADTLCVLAVTSLGTWTVAENGNSVDSFADLTEKTVFIPASEPYAEVLFTDRMRADGSVKADEITLIRQKNEADCLSAMLATPDSVAVLSLTTLLPAMSDESGVRAAIDITKEWEADKDVSMVSTVLAASRGFVEAHPDDTAALCSRLQAASADTEACAAALAKNGICRYQDALPMLQTSRFNVICGDAMRTMLENDASANGRKIVEDDTFYFGAAKREAEN